MNREKHYDRAHGGEVNEAGVVKIAEQHCQKNKLNRLPNRQTADDNEGPDNNDPSIKQTLYGIKGYEGASGTITFDENGDVSSKTFFKYEIVASSYKRLE